MCSRRTPIDQMGREDKVALALVLLKQLQPYLSVGTLSTQEATSAGLSRKRLPAVVRQSLTPECKDKPGKLAFAGHTSSNETLALAATKTKTNTADSDVGALQSILQNVNVSHRAHASRDAANMSESPTLKFPPI